MSKDMEDPIESIKRVINEYGYFVIVANVPYAVGFKFEGVTYKNVYCRQPFVIVSETTYEDAVTNWVKTLGKEDSVVIPKGLHYYRVVTE